MLLLRSRWPNRTCRSAGVAHNGVRLKEFAGHWTSQRTNWYQCCGRSLALEESTRMLVRITDLHDEAAGMHGQLAEALVDLERILARLEEKEPRTDL
jgi:hypothetical protein